MPDTLELIQIGLALAAVWSGGMWLYLAFHGYRYGADVERETFHLGLCFVLALGFLGLIETALLT
jgi:hypothetical protein